MMSETHILVLCGGTSDERAVSLRSGAAVTAGLQAAGYTVTQFDYQDSLPDNISSYDLVFPILHGTGGEDGSIQAQLDGAKVSYVGSGAKASQLCFDKYAYKQFLQTQGLPVSTGDLVTHDTFQQSDIAKQPFVLKPYDGGSSVDTIIARDMASIDHTAISAAFSRHGSMLLEPLATGVEITVGVLGGRALPVIEIIPPADGEFDYENKYNGQTQELCPPQHVSASVQQTAQQLALQIHELCGCRDFSRTDMIVTPEDTLVVLETNTIPGMTDQSLLPKAAAAAGLSFSDLTNQLVQLAFKR